MNFFERIMWRILKANGYLNAGYDYDLSHQLKKRALEETIQFIDKNMPNAMCFSPSPKERLLDYALSKISKKGDILEFGVRAGESITYIAQKLKDRTIHGFDSFEGLPEDWAGHEFLKHDFHALVIKSSLNIAPIFSYLFVAIVYMYACKFAVVNV